MNCFDINQNSILSGISVERLDGVSVGNVLIPFDYKSESKLSQMIVNGLLCDADFAEGKLKYRNSQDNDSVLVRLRTSTDNSGAPRAVIDTDVEIAQSQQYATDVAGGGIEFGDHFSWRVNLQLLFALKEGNSVAVSWSRQPKKLSWFARNIRKVENDARHIQIFRTKVQLLNGKPVISTDRAN